MRGDGAQVRLLGGAVCPRCGEPRLRPREVRVDNAQAFAAELTARREIVLLQPRTVCEVCEAAEAARAEADRLAEKALRELRALGIPERYADFGFERWRCDLRDPAGRAEQAALHSACRMFAHYVRERARAGRWLVLQSPGYGVGKTSLAVAILRDAWRRGVQGRFWSEGDLLDAEREAAVRASLPLPLWIVDDLGSLDARPQERRREARLLTERFERGGAAVLTTNLEPAAAAALLGERLTSRLNQALGPRGWLRIARIPDRRDPRAAALLDPEAGGAAAPEARP